MYEYSPIDEIYIKNFRNIGEVKLDFRESPIICLVGENEAGKTSVVKAFAVCALHANPRDQKDFIRDNTNMFGIAIKLEDGTIVKRIKMATVNKYAIEKPDGTIWDTAKLTDGLPVEVEKVMGLIEEPETKEFLHIRTYEDKLLFVVTPASTNYKVMYDVLKVDQLTRAMKIGSSEVNSLRSEISNNENSITTFTNTIRNIKIYDISILKKVKERVISQLSLLDKLDKAVKIKKNIDYCKNALGSIQCIFDNNLGEIDLSLVYRLNNAGKLLKTNRDSIKELDRIKNITNLQEIDYNILNKLVNVINKKSILSRKNRYASIYRPINEISEISEYIAGQLIRANTLYAYIRQISLNCVVTKIDQCRYIDQSDLDILNKLSRIAYIKSGLVQANDSIKQIDDYIQQVMNYMKQCGVMVTDCPKCGESIVIDRDLI